MKTIEETKVRIIMWFLSLEMIAKEENGRFHS